MANVMVIGASRGIGLETAKQALEASHTVRAMARSASSIAIRHANLRSTTQRRGNTAKPTVRLVA